jgi:hypothetical protein
MGNMHAQEYAAIGGRQALAAHLQSNHYPPVPLVMLPVAEAAIDHANADEWDALVDLPEGVEWRGKPHAPVAMVIDAFHLDAWLSHDEVGECDDCGATYDVADRFDHDANLGLCWTCSPHDLNDLRDEQADLYLAGALWDEVLA